MCNSVDKLKNKKNLEKKEVNKYIVAPKPVDRMSLKLEVH